MRSISVYNPALERERAIKDFFSGAVSLNHVDGSIPVREGYRIDTPHVEEVHSTLPRITAAVSREKIFPLLLRFCESMGKHVNVILDLRHHHRGEACDSYYRDGIDPCVLQSYLLEYEDTVLNDGRLDITVYGERIEREMQLTGAKIFYLCTHVLRPYERILRRGFHVPRNDALYTVEAMPHTQRTDDRYFDDCMRLATDIGAELEP